MWCKIEQSLSRNPGLHIQIVISMLNTPEVLFHVEKYLFKNSYIGFHACCPSKMFRCNQLRRWFLPVPTLLPNFLSPSIN